MADNIRDVYSVVFTSLGEEKLVQQLNKVKKAADDMTHSLETIQKLPGMNVAGGENASKLKSALKAVMDNEKIKQAAILKTEEVILKSDIKTAESQIKTAQKVSESLANNSLKFIALKQKEAQAKIEAERLYNQQFQKLLADEKEARAKMAAYVAADVAKDKAAKLKAADEYRQAFAKLQLQEIAAAQKTTDSIMKNLNIQLNAEIAANEKKLALQQAYNAKVIQMNEWQKQAFTQRTNQQLQGFFDNKAMTANNAAAWDSMKNVAAKGSELEGYMQLYAQRIKANEAEKQKLATTKQQTAELSKQLSLVGKISNGITGMKKGIQKFATDSFVFQRMFDSITRTLDEWSKMSIAMSQFRASANFENMNRQLDETVVRLGNVISKYEMIPAINKAKMLGMDFSGNKLSETLEMTTKVSQMFGMDATKAFGDFTVAISKASPIIMDNVGVLLRLEEAYKMFYDRQYKGKESFDKWTESLTQAEKRTIYYKEAMRLLSEKTEGVAVKTNEVQSVLMRLKDAWFKMGTDLEEAGSLNPIIWALEKVVSLAEGIANTFMLISKGYRALQFVAPNIFGSPDVGFDAKDMQGIFANARAKKDAYANLYGQKELDVARNYLDKLNEQRVKADERYYEALKEFQEPAKSMRTEKIRKQELERAKIELEEITQIQNKLADKVDARVKGKSGFGFLTQEDVDLAAKYVSNLKSIQLMNDKVKAAERRTEARGRAFKNAFENFELWEAYKQGSNYIFNEMIAERSVKADEYMLKTLIGSYDPKEILDAKKEVLDIDRQLATNQKTSTFLLGEYNTQFDGLLTKMKQFKESYQFTPERVAGLQSLKKTGGLIGLYNFDAIKTSAEEFVGDNVAYITQIRSAYDPKMQQVLQQSTDKMMTLNDINVLDRMKFSYDKYLEREKTLASKNLTEVQKTLQRNNINFRLDVNDSIINDVVKALTIGETDKAKIEETYKFVSESYADYKKLSKAGAQVGIMNNFVNMLLQNVKNPKEAGGRQKAPKEFWDKWYEMNRTAFTETLPEGITRDIEQARLDWFDQVKNLENLKKDILKAKREGRLDPEENLKFFGGRKDNSLFESQMKAFRDTIENNYSRMLDKMSKELQERLNEINPFQQFIKDANLRQLEEKGKRFSENPYSAIGGYITPLGKQAELTRYENNINRIKYANELKTIEKEKLAIQEEARKNIQAQTQLEIANLEAFKQGDKEWKNTAEFKIKKEEILKKYADMELLAMQDINNQYVERKKWTANILLDNSLTLGFLNKENEAVQKIAKAMADWNRQKNQYRAEDARVKSKFANESPDITAYGFNAMGFGETEESMAMKMGGAGEKVFNDLMKSRFSSLKMFMQTSKTDTAFNFQLGGANFELLGDEGKERLRAEAESMTNIFTDALDAIKKAVGDASSFWEQTLAEMFSGVANFAGNMAWNAITGEDVSGVQALREARKTDLKDQQENLKNKSITQETYAKRAYEIEKTYIENKKAAEKNYRNEQWKQLGAVFWAQGMGYMIKGGIDMFIPGMQATAQAELGGGAALMALGAMLGYGRGGKKAMSKANMAEESKATKQDINVYVDNKIFEDKRQLRQAINNASV